jgi:hypothetical protein
MPLNPMGVLDLSVVTQRLITLLEDCRDQSSLWVTLDPLAKGPTFTIDITGSAPDSVRSDGDCQLSVYLLHVESDKYQKNSPVTGPRVPPIPGQPLSLNLYYLITAFANTDWQHEQQAMSIALKCFHENPIVRTTVSIPVPPAQNVREEFSLTMEVETADELSRIWQATTVASRLSAVYKVSVVFMTPPAPPPPALPMRQIHMAVDATRLPFAEFGQITGTLKQVIFAAPSSTVAVPKIVQYDLSPATVAPGQRLFIFGDGLDQTPRVFLSQPGQPEIDISGWKVPDPDPLNPQFQTKSRITLDVPTLAPPRAGIYQIQAADNAAYRTNGTPISIAASITGLPARPNPPLLQPAGPTYTVNGVGFLSLNTEVLLDTVPLRESVLGPGTFAISLGGTQIDFQVPTNLPLGRRYTVRVRVGKVESEPGWWIDV